MANRTRYNSSSDSCFSECGFSDSDDPKATKEIDFIASPSKRQNNSDSVTVSVTVLSKEKKFLDGIFESGPLTLAGHRFKLVFRPNGLKYTTGYENAIGLWFKPLPCHLPTPAKMKMSIGVRDTEGREKTFIGEEDHSWDEDDTISDYPAFNFNLDRIQHDDIQKNYVNSAGEITLIINEH